LAVTEPKFKYNQKTLRYERASISVLSLALRGFGYLIFACLFFVGLVMLQNYVIDTPLENELRAENEALNQHKIILAAGLQESNSRISELKNEDRLLYEKLFETKLAAATDNNHIDKAEILAAEPGIFAEWESAIRNQSEKIAQRAIANSKAFSESVSIKKQDLEILKYLPTIAPVDSFEVNQLVSGFGKRINPFHKGLYHHDGVDIALPANSKIIATAPGTVILSNNSNLMAGFGNYIEIDHGKGIITRYAHLGELKVHYGQRVTRGQLIGLSGSSGGSIAPHLHYEVIKNGKNVNPVFYVFGRLNSDQYQTLVDNGKKVNQSLD
jgi:murein DD-endopeptidase MepM/ murein hydrolase activator NlpD